MADEKPKRPRADRCDGCPEGQTGEWWRPADQSFRRFARVRARSARSWRSRWLGSLRSLARIGRVVAATPGRRGSAVRPIEPSSRRASDRDVPGGGGGGGRPSGPGSFGAPGGRGPAQQRPPFGGPGGRRGQFGGPGAGRGNAGRGPGRPGGYGRPADGRPSGAAGGPRGGSGWRSPGGPGMGGPPGGRGDRPWEARDRDPGSAGPGRGSSGFGRPERGGFGFRSGGGASGVPDGRHERPPFDRERRRARHVQRRASGSARIAPSRLVGPRRRPAAGPAIPPRGWRSAAVRAPSPGPVAAPVPGGPSGRPPIDPGAGISSSEAAAPFEPPIRPRFADRPVRPAFGDRPRFGDRAPYSDRPRFGDRPQRPPFDRAPRTGPPPDIDQAELLGSEEELVAGRRPVEEAFVARRPALRLLVVPQRRQALERIVLHATSLRIPIVEVEGGTLTSVAGFDGHQGVALVVRPRAWATIDDVLARAAERGEPPFVLVLDSLEDPQNVGTLLRSAEAVGVHGVLFPTHHQAPMSPAAVKASAGATEHLLLVPVADLPGALAALHVRGVRVVGADEDAPMTGRQADLRGPLALVVGSEGQGIGPAVRRRIDLSIRIPMRGAIGSLNAAVAGSVLLFEILEQRGEAPTVPRPQPADRLGALDPAATAPGPEGDVAPGSDRARTTAPTGAPKRRRTSNGRRSPRPRATPPEPSTTNGVNPRTRDGVHRDRTCGGDPETRSGTETQSATAEPAVAPAAASAPAPSAPKRSRASRKQRPDGRARECSSQPARPRRPRPRESMSEPGSTPADRGPVAGETCSRPPFASAQGRPGRPSSGRPGAPVGRAPARLTARSVGPIISRRLRPFCGMVLRADVAQLVEQRFCKPPVPGSSPVVGSN